MRVYWTQFLSVILAGALMMDPSIALSAHQNFRSPARYPSAEIALSPLSTEALALTTFSKSRLNKQSFWNLMKRMDVWMMNVPMMNSPFVIAQQYHVQRWRLLITGIAGLAFEMSLGYVLSGSQAPLKLAAWLPLHSMWPFLDAFLATAVVVTLYAAILRWLQAARQEGAKRIRREFLFRVAAYSLYGIVGVVSIPLLGIAQWTTYHLEHTLVLLPWAVQLINNGYHLWNALRPEESDPASRGRQFGQQVKKRLKTKSSFIGAVFDMDYNGDFVRALGPEPYGREIVDRILKEYLWGHDGVIANVYDDLSPSQTERVTHFNIGGDETYLVIPLQHYLDLAQDFIRRPARPDHDQEIDQEVYDYAVWLAHRDLLDMQERFKLRSANLMRQLSQALLDLHNTPPSRELKLNPTEKAALLRQKMAGSPVALASDEALSFLVDEAIAPVSDPLPDQPENLMEYLLRHQMLPYMSFSLAPITDRQIKGDNKSIKSITPSRSIFRRIRALLSDAMIKAKKIPGKGAMVPYESKGDAHSTKPVDHKKLIRMDGLQGEYYTMFSNLDPNGPIPGLLRIPKANQSRDVDAWQRAVLSRFNKRHVVFLQLDNVYKILSASNPSDEMKQGGIKYVNLVESSQAAVDPLALIVRFAFLLALNEELEEKEMTAQVLTGQYADRLHIALLLPSDASMGSLLGVILEKYKKRLKPLLQDNVHIRTYVTMYEEICTAQAMPGIREALNTSLKILDKTNQQEVDKGVNVVPKIIVDPKFEDVRELYRAMKEKVRIDLIAAFKHLAHRRNSDQALREAA